MSSGLFRLLLRAYPREFRERWGEEMGELFEARRERAEAGGRLGRLWARTLRDTAVNAWALRRSGRRRRLEREGTTMGTLLQDLRFALRHLGRAPGFTLVAVALLGVGIGANITSFTVVDSLLLRPPAWEDPDRVVLVYQDSDDGEPSSSSYPATRDMARSEVFSAVAAISPEDMTMEGADGPTEVSIEFVTASYMVDVLGRSPSRGRWFGPEHDHPGAEMVAVVSEPTWRKKFGADPGIVGRTVRLNGTPVTVIGVGPRGLGGTWEPLVTDFWLSISSTPVGGEYRVTNLERREDHWYDVRARLAPGVTQTQAQAAMDALAARLAEDFPELNRGRGITVFSTDQVRVHPEADAGLRIAGGVLSALAAVVLLVVAANLANLLLVRGLGRSGEMAVRRALGAGGGRVVRLFFAESLLLAVAGGAFGLLLARWALLAIPKLPIPWPSGAGVDLVMDARVAAFTLALTALTGVLFGLAPAARSARSDVAGLLRDDRPSSPVGRGTARLRRLLVAVQVAASLVLVMGTGLLARSLGALGRVDTGTDADRVAFVRADLSGAGVEGEEARALLTEVVERVRALPGVDAVGATSRLPASGGGTTTTVVEGYTPSAGTEAVELAWAVVSDDYFRAMGVPLVAGRTFGEDEVLGGPTSVIINETAARTFWGDVDAVGRRMRGQGSENWRTVVGVVGDSPVGSLSAPIVPVMYYSDRQVGQFAPYVVVHTAGEPATMLDGLRGAVTGVRSSLTVVEQGTLRAHFGSGLDTPRLIATLLGAFACFAVLLAGLGVYAVVSFSVARRAPEIGIRVALGAERGRVVGLVMREVAGTVALGLAAGLAVAWALAPRLEGAVFGVRGLDAVTLAAGMAFMLAITAAAAWWPARRAAGADPVDALRAT